MWTSRQMMNMESTNTKSGFRLHAVEILNWGTFNRDVWRIEPHGSNSLLTGDVGSGKSTLVDALTCLIVPHQKISFNKAAGAEKNERNLATYIKGEYKNTKNDDNDSREKPVTLRYNGPQDCTFSVIVANFTNEGYHESVSLAQIFWIENEKVQKLLLIREKEPLSIKEHFSNIEDARELRKRLKELTHTETFDDNFSKYSQRFRYLFGMQTDKAIDLFNQTVSMKSVSSLTLFVRDQMLERTDIKNQIEDLKKRFDDLNTAYAAVQEARRQRDTLSPLVEFCETFRRHGDRILEIDSLVKVAPSYFASKKILLLESEIAENEHTLLQITGQLSAIEDLLTIKRDNVSQIKQDIRSHGGARLEKIAEEIQNKTRLSETKKTKHKEYSTLTEFCQLETADSEQVFFRNLKNAESKVDALRVRQDKILGEHGILAGQKSTIDDNIKLESGELESLKQRENQIPLEFLAIREQLAAALGINENDIPFAGELMQVRDTENEWEGALERLLRGFGVSMLVPEKNYHQISNYINQRRLMDNRNRGMRFEYFKVPAAGKASLYGTDIGPDSVVEKIEIKAGTPFQDWLESELQKRFNLRGVTIEEFQRMPSDVITKEGQYKVGNQRHIKDDRRELWDRKNFVLGWSNQEKIKAIEKHLHDLQIQKENIDKKIKDLATEIQNNTLFQTRLAQVIGYKNWHELNWKDEVEAIVQLENERNELKTSNNILNTLEQRLEAVLGEISAQEETKKGLLENKGDLSGKIKTYRNEIFDCREIVGTLSEGEGDKYYPIIDAETEDLVFTIRSIDKSRQKFLEDKDEERKKISEKQGRVRDRIIRTMREYKDKFPSDSLDLSDEIDARGEYLDKLEKILREGLPVHEATLKTMLNKNTIDDIVAFDNKLDIHEKEIRNKIKNINEHLKEIEFNKGTYIELIADRNRDQDVRIFKEDLKACYSNILDTEDAYTEDRFLGVQKILNRFRSNEGKDIDWTNKVTDVRNWFDFNASERYIETNEEKEFYSGSSGKSGGQKEKLAYTIIASALAYQFGLKIGEPKSKSFRFAVIDEAFGKGSDASAEYGLELFKKLNLQLLIVTPLQKIHIIENYINTVHYVSNAEGNNSELQNMTIEEYKSRKQLRNLTESGIEATETVG
jgi:uncharacterized protein YPO0396